MTERWEWEAQIDGFGAAFVTEVDLLRKGVTLDPDPMGIEPRFAEWFTKFQQQKRMRAVMEFARRGGLTYSQAREALADPDDLAAELAYDAWRAWDAARRCGQCGIDPDLVQYEDERGMQRNLKNPAYVAETYYCAACKDVGKAEAELAKDRGKEGGDVPTGLHVRLAPSPP